MCGEQRTPTTRQCRNAYLNAWTDDQRKEISSGNSIVILAPYLQFTKHPTPNHFENWTPGQHETATVAPIASMMATPAPIASAPAEMAAPELLLPEAHELEATATEQGPEYDLSDFHEAFSIPVGDHAYDLPDFDFTE